MVSPLKSLNYKREHKQKKRQERVQMWALLSNDPGKVDSNFFCFAAMVLFPQRNVLILTQRMHKPT